MNRLFYEDEFDALRAVIAHSGKSAKEVACHLFPHMKLESAYARLQACLNEEKDQRLTLSQIVALCKFCGQADALMFLADELGFEARRRWCARTSARACSASSWNRCGCSRASSTGWSAWRRRR